MSESTFTTIEPQLLAHTGPEYQCSIADTTEREQVGQQFDEAPRKTRFQDGVESNVFKNTQWTPDGCAILTQSEDEGLRTFFPDFSNSSSSPIPLHPHSLVHSPSRVFATCIYPLASTADPSTYVFLASPRDTPIRLHSLLHPHLIASYPLVCPNTERHLTPHSLLIPQSAPHTFYAGTESQISLFDLHRNGEGPTTVMKTISSKNAFKTPENMKGIITSLAITPDTSPGTGVLAAGTFSRWVGLYGADGAGKAVGTFELPHGEGGGITQVLWSRDGRLLYIAERRTRKVLVCDVRVTGKFLEPLEGRMAETNQRLGMDLIGDEVIAGGNDGVVRTWDGEGRSGRAWKAADDPVTSVAVHPGGEMVATSSGERKNYGLPVRRRGSSAGSSSDTESSESESESGESLWDNSLRIWRLPPVPSSADHLKNILD